MEIIDKKKYAEATLNANNKIFRMYVVVLVEPITMPIHPFCQAQAALLISEKTGIFAEYFDFSNIFSLDSAAELPENTKINDHFIDLLDNKQLPYSSIYSLGPVELKTLKT